MPDTSPDAALLSAATTEHFVLQSAASATVTEAAGRSTLYVMALSSALVALGFTADTPELFWVFALAVLPVVFVLGLFTVARLVDTVLENQQLMRGIARIRAHYRTLGPQAEVLFAHKYGRWPEPEADEPSLQLGNLVAQMGTTAWMICVINNAVAGAVVALAASRWLQLGLGVCLALGGVTVLVLCAAFYRFQCWRMEVAERAA